jgi:hypothetical protein
LIEGCHFILRGTALRISFSLRFYFGGGGVITVGCKVWYL